MEIFTVSLFGHRKPENLPETGKALERLEQMACELIRQKDYVEFLIGREGDFDISAASAIRKAMAKTDYGNAALILVLPYMKAGFRKNREKYLNYYSDVMICHDSAKAHHKSAIGIRNKYMVDRSDLVICCIEHKKGGAYKAAEYAEGKGCAVTNIFECE
ncbi:MAG: hypothetical protein K2K57_09925 [Oscillospiraceae bacterium]|nr:hypothetical protein [Oscillospiraceae bacterium]